MITQNNAYTDPNPESTYQLKNQYMTEKIRTRFLNVFIRRNICERGERVLLVSQISQS